jgi:hypothetical protein
MKKREWQMTMVLVFLTTSINEGKENSNKFCGTTTSVRRQTILQIKFLIPFLHANRWTTRIRLQEKK